MELKLFYREEGAGTPMILLHGNGEDSGYFEHQIAHFSRSYRVIAPDTRGHGRSHRGTAPFSIAQFAEDLKDLMDGLGIGRAILLGFSDGANIAMRFALGHPDRVSRLILNGGNLNAAGVKPGVQLPIELGYRITKLFAQRSPEANRHKELLGLMVNDPNIKPEELGAIRVPTLVIAGTRDMIKENHTKLIAESIPRSTLTWIPGDHFIARKQPAPFNAAVEAFLTAAGEAH